MQDGALAGARVLVTGADGFIGSHLVERLVHDGARVTAFVRYATARSIGHVALRNLREVADQLDAVLYGDLTSDDSVDAIVQAGPQIVLHLAADAWVPRSFERPREVVENNVASTLTVLTACRKLPGLERVVITSSSEVYGTAQTERIAEDHPLEPTSPYAASKVACDRLAVAWQRTFDLPLCVIRPFNTYGPRHLYDVIPKFIRLALEDRPLTVHGTGEQSRDFTYVDDMVEAFVLMASHPDATSRVVGFGTGEAVPIGRLAERIVTLAGSRSEIVHVAPRLAEVERLCCDATAARRLFAWQPRIDLDEGLRRNIAWAREAWAVERG